MLPVLFSLGPIRIYTLAFLVGIGFLVSSFLAWRRLRNLGLPEEKVIDLILTQALWCFIFSRAGYILIHFKEFGFFMSRWLLISQFPGFTFWGIVIGAILILIRFSKKNSWNFWQIADELTFSYLPFFVLIQIGSFFDGNPKGMPTTMPWGMFFPGDFIRRQPISLFQSVFLFLIWIFLLWAERRWRTWKWHGSSGEGFVSLVFLGSVSGLTSLLAFIEEGGLYYLGIKKIFSFLAFLGVIFLFCQHSGINLKLVFSKEKIISKFKKLKKNESG